MGSSDSYPYTVTNSGTNTQGNDWDTREQPGGSAYHYFNSDGSYYYSNSNGSTYHNDGEGSSTYTAPDGASYHKSDPIDEVDEQEEAQNALDGGEPALAEEADRGQESVDDGFDDVQDPAAPVYEGGEDLPPDAEVEYDADAEVEYDDAAPGDVYDDGEPGDVYDDVDDAEADTYDDDVDEGYSDDD